MARKGGLHSLVRLMCTGPLCLLAVVFRGTKQIFVILANKTEVSLCCFISLLYWTWSTINSCQLLQRYNRIVPSLPHAIIHLEWNFTLVYFLTQKISEVHIVVSQQGLQNSIFLFILMSITKLKLN
jgi:hypothetical protein